MDKKIKIEEGARIKDLGNIDPGRISVLRTDTGKITKNEIFGLFALLIFAHVLLLNAMISNDFSKTTGYVTGTGSGTTALMVKNDAPILTTIPDQFWDMDTAITIDLKNHFEDPEGMPLSFWSDNVSSLNIVIIDGVATITPSPGFVGIRYAVFYASDGPNTRSSNIVTLTVGDVPVPDTERPPGGGPAGGCVYRWECLPWSACLPQGYQERGCINLGTCSNAMNPPAVQRICVYSNDSIGDIEDGMMESDDGVVSVPDDTSVDPIPPVLEIPGLGQDGDDGRIKGSLPADERAENIDTICYDDRYGIYSDRIEISNMLFALALLFTLFGIMIYTFSIWYFFLFGAVRSGQAFVAYDSQRARNIAELRSLILNIDDTTFRRHVHHNTNDFADWIENALGKKKLADSLRTAKRTRNVFSQILNV